MKEALDKSRRKIIVCRDDLGLIREAASLFESLARGPAGGSGAFSVALAGGSTPKQLYRLLGSEPMRSAVPWDLVHLFWGDERCVPPDHPESNFRMAQEALICKVPIPPGNVHRILGELDPPEAAERYEAGLREFFGLRPGKLPRFDLVLLGIGDDGHTASLFPGSPALDEKERLVAAPFVAALGVHRITLTVPVLNHARRVVFLAAGRPKAAILRKVLQGERKPYELPAQLIQPTEGQLVFLFDRAADSEDASGLGL